MPWRYGAVQLPDSVMRYLGEDPWVRLKTISDAMGGVIETDSALPWTATCSVMCLNPAKRA